MDKCEAAVNAFKKTDNAQRSIKATKGKTKLDNIMEPLREQRRKIATMPDSTAIQREEQLKAENEVARHYSEAGNAKPSTPERNEITTRLKEDPEVGEYLRSLNYNDYADLRAEIQGTFGGEQARIAEIKFREVKIDDITPRLQQQGLYTQTIQDALGTIKGEGAINQRNFEMMRGLDDLSTNGLDAIQTGTARQTYNKMSAQMGKPITNDIFATTIEKNFDTLIEKMETGGLGEKLFRKLPTTDELKMFDDIKTGKRTPDGSAYEASMRMLDKINSDGWTTLRGAIKPLDELESADKTAIAKELVNRWSIKRMVTSPKSVAATTFAIAFGVPAYIAVTGMWQQTQFENNMQFGKWSDDKTSNGLWNRFLSDDAIKAQELAKDAQQKWLQMYNFVTGIPIIGDWYKLQLETVGSYSMIAGFDNDAKLNIFGPLVDKGMAISDSSSPWGFRRATEEEMRSTYSNDPGKLFLNDNKWQDEHTPFTEKTGIFTKTGKELTPTQAMKLYYAENGKFGASGSFDELEDESTMKAVREYGRKNDKSGQKTGTGQTTYTKAQIPTMDELVSQGLKCEGKNCTAEVYNRLLNLGWTIYEDPITGKPAWAQTQREIPKDATGNPVKILNQALPGTIDLTPITGGGGGGGSSSESDSETGRQSQVRKQVAEGEKSVDQEYVNAISKEGVPDIKKAKEDNVGISELAKNNRAGTSTAIKKYVKENVDDMDKNDMDEAFEADSEATADALLEASSLDCTE